MTKRKRKTYVQTFTPAQRRRNIAACARYHQSRPFITCADCGRWRQQYGTKPYCRACDAIHLRTGRPRDLTRKFLEPHTLKHCWVCLELFQSRWQTYLRRWTTTCSHHCAGVLRHLKHFRGRLLPCQGCGRTRIIRAKCLCASCYVLARLALNQQGVYGQCSSKVNRFAKVPGVLRA